MIKTSENGHTRKLLLQKEMATHSSVLSTSLVAQMVKHLSTMRETQVQSLGPEDPLEKEMATHSSTLAWRIPWKESLAGCCKKSDMTE